MADPKKDDASVDHFPEVVVILLGFYFVLMVLSRIQDYLIAWRLGTYHTLWGRILLFFIHNIWPMVKFVGVIICVLTVWGIVYSYKRLSKVIVEEREIYGSVSKESSNEKVELAKNQKWERVIEHINSANPSDWKLAIIEADIMLDDLLRAAGYHGDTLGEMLKAVEKSDFTTIESAWEAHKVRNQIAHQGADFDLNERDAKRVVSLYEAVFREFKVI